MKIVSLIENTASRPELAAEHGLSLYIEANGKRILFDMGQTSQFARNAEILGIDLSAVDLAVLSHGHYDHGGGLSEFLKLNKHAPVYVHREAFAPHYNGTEKYIGLDPVLASHPRLIPTSGTINIGDRLTLFDANDRARLFAPIPSGLTTRRGDDFLPDDFRHEQYLLIEENGKKVLISGCSHKGIQNIMAWFCPDVLIGGFHFSKIQPGNQLAQAAATLSAYSAQYYTCHCTGPVQYESLRTDIPRLNYLSGGSEIIL